MSTRIHTPRLSRPVAQRALHVLLVDDCDADRELMTHLLRQAFGARLRLREADDPHRALQILERVPMDVVLIDYRLPGMDGLTLMSQVVELADQAAVLLMTGHGSQRLAAEAIQHGAAEYLIKGETTVDQLAEAIERACTSHRMERRNTQIVEKLRHQQNEMDHFVRALSHDMSVNFMLLEHSLSELKKSCGDSPLKKLTDGFAHVEASLRESKRFVDDLVRLSQTGKVDMEPTRLDTNALLKDVLFEQQETLRPRHIAVDVAADLPAIWCNETRAKQVFTNLLRNAARHGCDRTQPRILISVLSEETTRQQAAFCLHDNGPGIPERWHEEIFLPGRRVPGTQASGNGMGLAIVRKIVDYYGGAIRLESSPVSGTSFIFTLPRPAQGV